jgi:tetratricopeptide (TPR) repeat protein/predicted Ser/Thr protein kinase
MACPDPTELACFALRTLDAAAAARVQEHVDGCAPCRAASSALVTASRGDVAEGATWARPDLAIGAQLDRFVILHELGEGAASVVYAAYDPELDRKVALKVLRSRGAAVDDKLLREGRALAKLDHPNVVGVYEIGNVGGQLYIALELVNGVTARQWAAIEKRSWRAVRDVYIAAGRGLAALHRAGLVHRDVKPDNIVVAGDGRVRLVDFGLVGAGAGAGTPRYMAPEGNVDGRSDLFSLAVSLDEALAASPAPRRVRTAIARARSSDPKARFASVEAFVEALSDRPRWHYAVPAALVAAALGAGGAYYLTHDDGATCDIAAPWSGEDRAAIAAAIDHSGRKHAESTRERVLPKLEAFATAWGAERARTCEAYHEHHDISAERFDREVACLERQRRAFDATVAVLRRGDADVVDHAIDLVSALPDLADCSDDVALARTEPLPSGPGARDAIAKVEDELARAEVAQRAGDPKAALETARRALAAARETQYRPVVARAAYTVADLLERAGEAGESRALVDETIETAAAARLDEIEAKAWTLQLYMLGFAGEAKDAELATAQRAAEAAVVRARDELVRARLENTLGLVAKQRGDFAAARDHYTKALGILRAIDPTRPEIAATLSNLSVALSMLGDLDGARKAAEEAAQRDRELFGPDHPSYADSLSALASREMELGDLDQALRHGEQALAIQVATYGEDSPPAMISHHGLAHTLAMAGKLDDAEKHATRALELAEKLRGPEHPETAKALLTIANLAAERKDLARAAEVANRALAIVDKTYGADHPLALSIHANLGIWALDAHDPRPAEAELRPALAGMLKTPESPYVAVIRTALGSALLDLGKRDEAIRELEAALALREKIGDEPVAIADTQFTLARALWSSKRDRALTLARKAIATFEQNPERAVPYLPGIRGWIEKVHAPLEAP